jgi:hypothetical protein
VTIEELHRFVQMTCKWPVGTKIAKQFYDKDGTAKWFDGIMRKYINDGDLYWILYSDGDMEDLNAAEMQQAVEDYKTHFGGADDIAATVAIS